MYDRILVPTDGSEGTTRPVRLALAMADTWDATVHLLYVVDTRQFAGVDHDDLAELERSAIQSGQQALTDIREQATGSITIKQSTRKGAPHAEIIRYAKANEIDLVALGTHARTEPELTTLGSTTDRILRQANIPVLTVQLTHDGDGPLREDITLFDDILVPTDGSDPSFRAAEHAVGIAERFGATVHIVYIVDTAPFTFEEVPRSILGSLREGGKEAVAYIESLADEAGIPSTRRVAEGTPPEEIIHFTDELDIDLITAGRRGQTGDPEVLLGSTIERLIRLSEPPVLSVP